MSNDSLAAVRDSARLAALRRLNLLDTPPDEEFDRLARLASKLLGVPVALVTLVDEDRTFFKSCLGLPAPWSDWRAAPHTHSLCQHVVAMSRPLVITDAREEPVLRDSQAVTELGVVAYLGVPLMVEAGHSVGTFCVIDTRPREWTPQEVGLLKELTALILREIELRREVAERQRLETELRGAYAELDERVRERTAQLAEVNEALRAELDERARREREREHLLAREHKEKELSDSIIESLPGVFYMFDAAGMFVRWNKNFERITGYTAAEVRGLRPADLFAGADRGLIAERIAEVFERGPVHAEARLVSKGGVATPYFLTGRRILVEGEPHLVGMGVDISERWRAEEALREREEQLRQSQKMEAIGRLAGGVAHDFNNLLTAIIGYAELAQLGLPAGHPAQSSIAEVKQASKRAADLTRQLLAFSRRQVLQPKVINLNAVIGGVENLLRRLIGEDVRLETALEPGLGSVRADPVQVEQVIMNLAINARDAMPRGGGLRIETGNVHLDTEYAERHGAAAPGPYVLLSVTDTGEGMGEETLASIFEPFFTTKEPGKGTGLGLSTVYGIVKQSGGFIQVSSVVGSGTTFQVYLPRVGGGAKLSEPGAAAEAAAKGAETVLLVEDEELVRGLTRQVLEMYGYRVLEAAHGEEALAVSGRHAGRIDLLLTDVVMPGMSGPALAEQITRLRPEVRVLYMSGHIDNAALLEVVSAGGAVLIQKPFDTAALARRVREVLDAPPRSA